MSNYFQIANLYPHLKNPHKYKSPNKQIICRSGWEIKFCQYMDRTSSILEWNSEEIVIPYLYPVDGKTHRYFVDFWMKVRAKDGSIKEYLVEIKPYAQTIQESIQKPKRVTKSYIERVNTYIKNQSKWAAAREWCKKQRQLGRDIEFTIVTEKDGLF
jgi:hypothetical protein